MFSKPTIVAVNGSPHGAVGNTARMIEMLRPTLAEKGFELEVIHLTGKNIEYCTGCGLCMEKGRCWIEDDHREITGKLLAADGIILGSPVYFLQVTGQMKTFLDRSLAFGHKPQPGWKPGLAISVSAGLGETDTANYLAFFLRTFGAFSVGTLTAMATQVGGFLGKEAVEARAVDLARDLARAIRENRRYPAADRDLRFYQFMASLVKSQKDTVMKHDDRHWQEHGLYDSFEKYVQQTAADAPFDTSRRDAWIQGMIEEQKAKRKARPGEVKRESGTAVHEARELIQGMPLLFKAESAGDLKAVVQFEVTGEENFLCYLSIANGRCTHHEGPAEKPDLVIKTPAEVWLKISRGELSGQKAFMEGQYRVGGDVNLLLKFKNLFSG